MIHVVLSFQEMLTTLVGKEFKHLFIYLYSNNLKHLGIPTFFDVEESESSVFGKSNNTARKQSCFIKIVFHK